MADGVFKVQRRPSNYADTHDWSKVARLRSFLEDDVAGRVNKTLEEYATTCIDWGFESVADFARTVVCEADAPEHFYVFDLGAVLRRWHIWVTSLPRVKPHYAVKCNPDPAMLSLLAALGTGFDCASPAEIEMVRRLGVGPERIIYAHCCKMPKHLQMAKSHEIQLTTFDTEAELYKVKQYFPDVGLVLRIRADDPAARCNLGDKYGAEEDEVEPLMRVARDEGLKVVGISFHVGSGARDPNAFPIAVKKAREAFDLGIQYGHKMRLLDLGGGYSGNMTEGITMETLAESLNNSLEKYFPASEGVDVIAEPGRFFAEPGMTLFTRVFGKRVRTYNPDADSHYYWISDGAYGSMNCILYDHAQIATQYFPANDAAARAKSKQLHKSTVYGPTCDGMDTLLRGIQLPDLAIGDWLVWPHMGAYTLAAGSNFNGFDSQAVDVHYVFSPPVPNPSEAARSKFSSLPGHAHDLQSVLDEVLAEGPPEAIPEDQQVN